MGDLIAADAADTARTLAPGPALVDGAEVRAEDLAVGRGGRTVLRGIDLAIAPGEQLALVGANGSGKTTLLRALAGLDQPLAGRLTWAGGPLPPGPARVRSLGVLFQAEPPGPFTVAELVALGLGLDGPPGPTQRDRVTATLARLDLTALAHRPCTALSGGEWQRAALGRALVAGARVLLLDEPASHLDPARRAGLRRLLDSLRPEVAVVLATHDLEQAALCDRVLLLAGGGPLALGPAREVLTPDRLAAALDVEVRRLDDPEGGPPLFRVLGPARSRRPGETPPAPPAPPAADPARPAARPGASLLPRGGRRSLGVLVVGHGSREAKANEEFLTLVEAFRARVARPAGDALARPVDEVAHAHIELVGPFVDEALAALAARHDTVVVLPLFLLLVGHAKNDLPIALARARAAFPAVRFSVGRELGIHTLLLDLLYERAAAATPPEETGKTAVIVVGRGSSDPDANGELCKLVRLFGEGRGFAAVAPAFAGITSPRLADALEQAARSRPGRILVVPHLLFAGRLVDRLREETAAFGARYPWIRTTVAGHLGPDPRLGEILEQRLAEALSGRDPLPCDTCQYRVPVAGVASSVGGLRALLWSVRHGFTHSQAAPHLHAHRPLSKHVLVCGNVDCAAGGSLALLDRLRRLIKRAGRQRDIRVTRTSCMGRCGEGPTVAVYPDGVWYRAVRETDAEDLVREHLLADRLVARLVDNIMQ